MAGVRTLLLWAVVTECWILLIMGSCPAGKFGHSCMYSCHCGQSCNQTTGVCGGDCDSGWVGGHGGTCQKENIAYMKHAASTSVSWTSRNWTADKAVDGNRDQEMTHGSCFHSLRYPSVWTVDLGQQYRIHNVRIYNRDGYVARIQTAVLSLRNSSSSAPGVPCYTFPSNTIEGNSVYDVICDGRGQYLTITHTWADLNLCEVEIYECSRGTYGQNCSKRCTDRNCAGNSSCDHVTGSCLPGCKVGWMGTDCVEECSRGTYGQNCSKRCTDRNCAGNSPCDHVTGSCVHGCNVGWMGTDCVEECDQDHYGPNCNDPCGNRNCATNTSSCDRRTGSCDTGCLPGWTAVDCTQECSSRTYGQNCSKQCTDRNCAGNSSCDHVTGSCVHGCKAGWIGIDCEEECDENHYGVHCNETCGNRDCATEKSSCDPLSGSCDTGCLPGWTKVDCREECTSRTYGQNCSKQCTDRNCAGNSSCDHVTGSCVPGCKAGWMGTDCVEGTGKVPICDKDRYGANCDKACASRHCRGSSSCNSAGDCDSGCETGWTSNDCTEEARLPQGAGYNAVHLAVAVAVAFVVGAAVSAVIVSVVWWRRKRRPHKTSESHPDSASNAQTNQSQSSDDGGPESRTYDSLHAETYDAKMTGETYCTITSVNTDSEAHAATSNLSKSVRTQMYGNLHHTSGAMDGEYSEIGKP